MKSLSEKESEDRLKLNELRRFILFVQQESPVLWEYCIDDFTKSYVFGSTTMGNVNEMSGAKILILSRTLYTHIKNLLIKNNEVSIEDFDRIDIDILDLMKQILMESKERHSFWLL